MTNVVIVESPAKAKTINKYLGNQYKVFASYGHVRNLPKKMAPLMLRMILNLNGRSIQKAKSILMRLLKR